MPKVKVYVRNNQKDVKVPTGIRLLIRKCCQAVLVTEKFEHDAEVSVSFVDNKEIRQLNKIYRNKDKAYMVQDKYCNCSVRNIVSHPSLGTVYLHCRAKGERKQA